MENKAKLLALLADLDKCQMKCDECDQKFWLESRLEKHRLIHNSCSICKEAFCDKTNLSHHLLSHYQLEADPCPVCRDLCSNPDDLLQHLQTMHIEYLKEKEQKKSTRLWEKYPQSMSSSRFTQYDTPEVDDFYDSTNTFDEFDVPELPKEYNPPTDVKNNETRKMHFGVKRTTLSESFIPSKQSKNVQRQVSTESSQDLVSNPHHISSSSNKYNLEKTPLFCKPPFFSPFTHVTCEIVKTGKSLSNISNGLRKGECKEPSYDISLRGSTKQNTSSNSVEKSKIIKQKVPVISTPKARLSKVIIGETLNNFQKLNSPKSNDTLVPVNLDLNVLQNSLSNRKIVKVSPECMKESLLKDSPAANIKHVCVAVPPKMLKQLELMPTKSELKNESVSTTTIVERKESNTVNQPDVKKILQEQRRRKDEKEKIKKKEKILKKMLIKYEEKEEKKLMKYFQKIVRSHIKKKQGNLNRIEKMLIDIVENKSKLLEIIRQLKCSDQNDVEKLFEHFGMKFTRKNYITRDKEAMCSHGRKVVKKIKPVKSSSVSKIEPKPGMNRKGRKRKISMPKYENPNVSNNIPALKYFEESEEIFKNISEGKVCSNPEREENLLRKSETPYLFNSFNSHKTVPFGEDPFTDMSIITDETYTIACPCGKVSCGFHSH